MKNYIRQSIKWFLNQFSLLNYTILNNIINNNNNKFFCRQVVEVKCVINYVK